jgi:hypothetical protein
MPKNLTLKVDFKSRDERHENWRGGGRGGGAAVGDPLLRVRQYDPAVVEQLRVLRFFRSAGISTEAIAAMFAGDAPHTKARNRHEIVLKRTAELDELIVEARRMKRRLTKLLVCKCRGDMKRCVIFREKRIAWDRLRLC